MKCVVGCTANQQTAEVRWTPHRRRLSRRLRPLLLTHRPPLLCFPTCRPCREESNDAWQHVAAPADMPGQYRTFYNNPTAEEWDEEQIAV